LRGDECLWYAFAIVARRRGRFGVVPGREGLQLHLSRARRLFRASFGLLLAGSAMFAVVWCVTPARDRARFIADLEDGKHQTIVFYGTSLTAARWVTLFTESLDQEFPGQVRVVNAAQGGVGSLWALERLEARVLAENPDAVFLEFAINDAATELRTPLERSRVALEEMIDRIRRVRPDCEILLMTMNPPIREGRRSRPRYVEYYEVYRQVARERGLRLIDHEPNWQRILEHGEIEFAKVVPDGIHPNELGQRSVILPEMRRALGLD